MKLYIIGFGPGGTEYMTLEAKHAIEDSDVIVGYTVYVDLLREHFQEKEFYTTPMKKEKERCQWAIDTAVSGKRVALVCSGDSGVYGMAGLVLELIQQRKEKLDLKIHVVAGVTAACSGAAVLGAPLNHDFAVISLSDLLTPWELIEKRLECAAMGDFCICLYNPSSHKRQDYLQRACEIVEKYKNKDTVCGYVKNIGRQQQEKKILTLEELKQEQVDMFTTVFIGNSQTSSDGEWMVTPRGYAIK